MSSSFWTPIETQFHIPCHPIAIIDIMGSSGEAKKIDDFVYHLDAVTRYYAVGCPGDFLSVLSDPSEMPRDLVICGHGDETGFVFGDFADEIDTSMLRDGSLPSECIAKEARLPDRLVVNTSCEGGLEHMAQAFKTAGVQAYIGAIDAVDFASTLLFVLIFFDNLWRKQLSIYHAWEKAASYDKETALFVLYDSQGRRSRVG